MNFNTEKTLLIKEIQRVQDLSLLKVIRTIIHYGLKNEGGISNDQYNRELEEAEAEIDRGEFTTKKVEKTGEDMVKKGEKLYSCTGEVVLFRNAFFNIDIRQIFIIQYQL